MGKLIVERCLCAFNPSKPLAVYSIFLTEKLRPTANERIASSSYAHDDEVITERTNYDGYKTFSRLGRIGRVQRAGGRRHRLPDPRRSRAHPHGLCARATATGGQCARSPRATAAAGGRCAATGAIARRGHPIRE